MGRTQRLALITATGLAVIAITYFIAIGAITSVTRTRVESVLTTVRDTTLETLLLWMSQVRGQVTGWANSSAIVSQSQEIIEDTSLSRQAALSSLLEPASSDDHYKGFFLVGRNNKVLASSQAEEIGETSLLLEYSNYFVSLFSAGDSFISIPVKQTLAGVDRVIILAGAPVRNLQGQVIAGLVFYIDPFVDFSRILQNGRLLSTGETYAVNSDGLLVSNSRFDDQLRNVGIIGLNESSILNIFIKDPGANLVTGESSAIPEDRRTFTRMATSLLLHETASDIDGYLDYRGVEVVGAWTWNEDLDFGIATEVDKAEAFSNISSVKPAILLLSLLSGVALAGTVFLSNLSDQRERLIQKRYELTVEGAKEAIISFDSKNSVIAWNNQAEQMFGWSKQEVIGKDVSNKLLPAENQNFYLDRLEEIRREKDYFATRQRREIEMTRRDGNRFPVDVFLVPVKVGNDEGYSAIIRDLTDIKEAQRQVEQSHEELESSYDATLLGWSNALDLRDNETEGHTQRVTKGTMELAKLMEVPEPELIHFYRGALLHDIGKIGIPDNILLKPGQLNDDEWKIMRLHPMYAYNMLKDISYLKPALYIPHYHHEKWDGTGYPEGLKGNDIPFMARLFSIIDVWDALGSDRPYRKAWKHEDIMEYLSEQSGKQFDPEIVYAFFKLKG